MESLKKRTANRPWMVSMHGGHSGDYCDHAVGSLRELLVAAIDAGYHTFGVTEHAPRGETRFLYPNEIALGWTVEKTKEDFERYSLDLQVIREEFQGKLTVVRGFETEVVPKETYRKTMGEYRNRVGANGDPMFDYMLGSVHFVDEVPIDGEPENWRIACDAAGGPESLAVAYYCEVASMVDALKPDVVGHLDLIKLNAIPAGFDPRELITPKVIIAADNALESICESACILDLNTAGWRKGLDEPYPAPWLIKRAAEINIPFCFGDDSHRTEHVGVGIERARTYLMQNGVTSITAIEPGGNRRIRSLE